ncbi:MAG: MiaB/RimO family radical SAM methylthiotransferase, partial [Nitrospirae bacterium]
GCNYRCTYCNIWMARGRSRSRPVEDVLTEVLQLESEGYGEVVLTGIHIGLYGRDIEGNKNLNYLLKKLLLSTSKIRIRLGSLEVKEIDDETVDLLCHERACRHLHIPLQSGDDEILKRMGRNYTSGDFFSRVEDLKKKIPGIAIGADLIVGFPGETDESFNVTKRRISESEISYLHVFPFSKRPNTKASEMRGQVSESVKKKRAAEMREVGRGLKERFLNSQRGKIIGVLIEESLEDTYIKGKSDNYINVYMKTKGFEQGKIVNVKIDKAFRDGVLGNILH